MERRSSHYYYYYNNIIIIINELIGVTLSLKTVVGTLNNNRTKKEGRAHLERVRHAPILNSKAARQSWGTLLMPTN